jgi:hypothetical protein
VSYLLDAMIVSYFFQAGRKEELGTAAKQVPMALVDEVRRELEKEKSWGAGFKKWLGTSNVEVRSIVVGTPPAETLKQLVPAGTSGKDVGERASIALAAHDPSLTFVTHDKGGMWIALREIWRPGDRILGLVPFLRRLFEEGALTDPLVLDTIMKFVDASHRPTWWASWRAGLTSGGAKGS